MLLLNDPYLNHPESMPVALPSPDQIRGNRDQLNMIARSTQPLPTAGSSGRVESLIVSAEPFPYWLDATWSGIVPPPPVGLLPRPDPPAWLPQGGYKYGGGDGAPGRLPDGKV
jgi:hypothetical protein